MVPRGGGGGEDSGENVGGQREVFEGVEGDVSVVHHGEDQRDVSALKRQRLQGSQVGHRAAKADTHRQGGGGTHEGNIF